MGLARDDAVKDAPGIDADMLQRLLVGFLTPPRHGDQPAAFRLELPMDIDGTHRRHDARRILRLFRRDLGDGVQDYAIITTGA